MTGAGSIYGVSKHAVTRLTEGLYFDLQARDANIGVTCLCPTRKAEIRNRCFKNWARFCQPG